MKTNKTLRILSVVVLVLSLIMALGITSWAADTPPVAKVGNTEYATIDEAIANWTKVLH